MPFFTTTTPSLHSKNAPLLLLLFLLPLSSSSPHTRRILHQPIFTTDSPPPSSPPSPPSPDYPFSTSSPFFPSSPPPPPPPSPSSLASFPANISSLTLPPPSKSKPTSTKLIIISISSIIAAILLLLIALSLHLKKRKPPSPSLSETKTTTSNSSSFNITNRNMEIPKLTRPSQTSSEFLYLGTLVNSNHVVLNTTPTPQNVLNTRKMDSPELHPLPPLLNRQITTNSGVQNLEINVSGRHVEGSDEFYSPRESVGTGSRRGFEVVDVMNKHNNNNNMSGSCSESSYSCSSSLSGSPARSPTISPTISLSPKKQVEVLVESSPVVVIMVEIEGMSKESMSPRISNGLDCNDVESRVNMCGSVEENVLVFNPFRFLSVLDGEDVGSSEGNRNHALSDQNEDSGGIVSSTLEDSDEHIAECNSTSSVVSDQNVDFPDKVTCFVEPGSSDVLDQSVESPKSVTMVSGLAVKDNEYNNEARNSDVSDQSVESPKSVTMVSGLAVKDNEYNNEARNSDVSDQSVESLKSVTMVSDLAVKDEPQPRSLDVSDQSVTSPVKDNGDSFESYSQSLDQDARSPERVASPVMQMVDVSDLRSTSSNVTYHHVESPERFASPVTEMVDVSESYSTSSNVPDHSVESPVKQETPAVLVPLEQLPPPISVPPPPPPPPPMKYWESPRTPTSLTRKSISGPPALVAPLRPMVIESPILISPMQLPTQSDNQEGNEVSVGTSANLDEADERSEETPKPKLKPLHWDKVRASSDREMVWDQLRSSSFKLNEEMIESLFIVKAPNPTHLETTRRQILPLPSQENRVLDAKKSQNIAILLKALHVTVDEVCESLLEGNAETLGTDLLESLLKMAPSKEEEHNLKEHKDDSPVKLGPAERFLKEVLDIPFAFKRVDAMLYISNFDSEVEYLKKSFETLETASEELRNSRMFLKLLEAVLKTGNRMNVGTNRGDAHAFKLDTLLKLVDIKGADGKTTLLHFVVQEITRSEGARISDSNPNQTSTTNDDVKCRKLGLQVVSSLASDLTNVKKAAAMDSEVLNSDVMKLSMGLEKIMEVIRLNETIGSDQISSNKFSEAMNRFMKIAEEEIIRIQAQESVALTLVKEITEYFHGNSAKEEAHPFRIFMVVRDFLSVLERVCKEVGMINERTIVSSAHKFPVPVNPMLQPVSSGFPGRPSDDESPTS